MREIKFRGKTKMAIEELNDIHVEHEDGWFYGHLVMYGNTPYIVGDFIEVDQDYTINEFWVPVYPESVGQYTGLKDKNGKEIYETDIVKYKDYAKEHISKVIQNFRLGTGHYIKSPGIGFYSINERTIKDLEIEVIGNVFEDSHLLEEQHG